MAETSHPHVICHLKCTISAGHGPQEGLASSWVPMGRFGPTLAQLGTTGPIWGILGSGVATNGRVGYIGVRSIQVWGPSGPSYLRCRIWAHLLGVPVGECCSLEMGVQSRPYQGFINQTAKSARRVP